MVTSRAGVREFLEQDLDDCHEAKRLSERKLDALLARYQPDDLTDKYAHQKVAYLLARRYGHLMVLFEMGGGKALPDDEMVPTQDRGFVPMSSLRPGELVLGLDGRPTRITGVFPQGRRSVFRVVFSDGVEVRSTMDHLWSVYSAQQKWRGQAARPRTLEEIAGSLRCGKNWRHYVPLPGAAVLSSDGGLLDPYVLGVLIADGALSGSNCSVTLGPRKEAVLAYLRARLEMTPYKGTPHTWGVRGLRRVLGQLGLRCRSPSKRVPKNYLFADVQSRRAMLAGILDCDGTCSRSGSVSFVSASPGLVKDVTFLVRSLGGVAILRRSKIVDGREYPRLGIRMPAAVEPFSLVGFKLDRFRSRGGKYGPTRAIVDVIPDGEANCTCISVEAPDGIFLAGDFVPTHNTKLSLDLHRDWGGRMLVLVPNNVNVDEWREQASIHSWDRRFARLDGQEPFRMEEITVGTYQGLASLVREERTRKRGKQKGKTYWGVDRKKAEAFAKLFDVLVMDEISSCKNSQKHWFRSVRAISKHVPHRLGLTGTPMDKDPIDLWAPFYLVDHGASLGTTLGIYRDAFFRKERGYWAEQWVFRKDMRDELSRRMRHRSVFYSADECQDMPRVQGGLRVGPPMVRTVSLPRSTWAYHSKLVQELERGRTDRKVVRSVYMRMRQLSSGWLGVRHEEHKLSIEFEENPKLDLLVEMIRQVDQPVVVAHHFRPTGEMIARRLRQEKIPHARVYGAQSSKTKGAALASFKRGEVPVLVGSSAIAYGVNLQSAARYMLVFESPDSVVLRRQLEARIDRGRGLPGTRHIYDLHSRGTMDAPILDGLVDGRDLWEDIRRGRASLPDLIARV